MGLCFHGPWLGPYALSTFGHVRASWHIVRKPTGMTTGSTGARIFGQNGSNIVSLKRQLRSLEAQCSSPKFIFKLSLFAGYLNVGWGHDIKFDADFVIRKISVIFRL